MEIKKEYVLSGCDLDQYERLVWQRLRPMLRCWRILEPLRPTGDFDTVTSSLERIMMLPETIEMKLGCNRKTVEVYVCAL
jgi:hypothetical protein